MRRHIILFIKTFLIWTLAGMAAKVPFLAIYHYMIGAATLSDYVQVLLQGLRLDAAIAGYLTILATPLIIASVWTRHRAVTIAWHVYALIAALALSLAVVANIALYGYWGFPLDSTPLLYLRTSPSDAFASAPLWQPIIAFVIILLCTGLLTWLLSHAQKAVFAPSKGNSNRPKAALRQNALTTFTLLLLAAVLIIPIRGGFGTGTNHTGSVYFSGNIRLNHAAVNPVFSFLESVMHQQKPLREQYRFMPDKEATRIVSTMTATNPQAEVASNGEGNINHPPLGGTRGASPNLVIVCLESFSRYVMQIPDVTPCLNHLTTEGIYFTHFYANSQRTDRGLVSVLSGLPAQPSMSIMDTPSKSGHLPSIARSLSSNGYATHFYYGGDTNYSNMRSYIMGTGYQQLTCDKDFSARELTSKWGAPDEVVYNRMLRDIRTHVQTSPQKPFMTTIMTESSHEPFDVPFKAASTKVARQEELNAFAYADHCLGEFIRQLKQLPCWQNTVVVVVADHLGAWPLHTDNYALWRYHIPLVITGGAVTQRQQLPTLGSQCDIAATVLGMMGITHADFPFSKDLLDASAPHFAWMAFPDAMCLVETTGTVFYDNSSSRLMLSEGNAPATLTRAKAFLQKLYDYLDSL